MMKADAGVDIAESARVAQPMAAAASVRRPMVVIDRELKLRLASSLVLIPAVVVLTYIGEPTFALIVLLTSGLVLIEWFRMIGAGANIALKTGGLLALIAVSALAVAQSAAAAIGAIAVGCIATALLARFTGVRVSLRWVVAGFLYASLTATAFVALRNGPDGFGAIIFVFLIAWSSDTFAYFVGRRLRGPRLWPRVSPSKTWSGAVGGLVGGALVGAVAAIALSVPLTPAVIVVACVIAIASQAGDLLQSAFKRHFAIKDAGSLIPGHGGVMDRVDGLVTASIVTLALGMTMGMATPASGLFALMGR